MTISVTATPGFVGAVILLLCFAGLFYTMYKSLQ